MIELASVESFRIPVERCRLKMGVKSVFFKKHAVAANGLSLIAVHSPYVEDTATYLPGGQIFTQLAIYHTQNKTENIFIDYSDRMKFYSVDFTHSDNLVLDVRDMFGARLKVEGVIVFEIDPIPDT